ncbi:MAG: DMT family transporter [Oscillatoriales cyanobacterium RU_3_3]|nr:DMT family transporter [Microcoleus sp. SU_5_6]NJM60359.1 DMT family transporter [Oscillatoriales cyanobacterium RU_3_3]NJR22313.1 DMT family transporter [Richelia sp. CSU_2_1]
MNPPTQPPKWSIALVLIIGVLAVSTASILIRLANQAAGAGGLGFSLVLAASRLTLSAVIILPAWPTLLQQRLQPGAWLYASAAGLCLAAHFALWITSLTYTSIAASTALVTTNPVWVALLSRFWFGEKLSKLSVAGIAIALFGTIAIALGSAGSTNAGSDRLLGDFLALAGSWAVSLYLLLGREAQRRGLGISGYSAIAYTTAAIALLPLPFAFNASYTGYSHIVYLYILLTALLPQLIGHTVFNWAVVRISPTLVTLAILFEPVGASYFGYLLFGEVPAPAVLAGAGLLLLGVAAAAFGAQKSQ